MDILLINLWRHNLINWPGKYPEEFFNESSMNIIFMLAKFRVIVIDIYTKHNALIF